MRNALAAIETTTGRAVVRGIRPDQAHWLAVPDIVNGLKMPRNKRALWSCTDVASGCLDAPSMIAAGSMHDFCVASETIIPRD